jgi:DNA (cytosine-5)-methyltransferase 1
MIKIGSLFSGIGGFELGLERAWTNSETIWQVEKDPFCQSILRKHWPNSIIFDDVCDIGSHNLSAVDVLCGGFPCQDISIAGQQRGIIKDETRSGLWWEMWRVIGEIRPRVVIMENVSNITSMGGLDVVGSLAKIGYCVEWGIISASQCGAPHQRKRWFCVGYTVGESNKRWTSTHSHGHGISTPNTILPRREAVDVYDQTWDVTNSNREDVQRRGISSGTQKGHTITSRPSWGSSFWKESNVPQPTICGVDDGISGGLDRATKRINNKRLRALGNAIVPQCSEWIGQRIVQAGLLDDLLEDV